MIGLLSAASSVLGGASPLSGAGVPEGPQTSQAETTTTVTQTTGAFNVGSGSAGGANWIMLALVIAGVYLIASPGRTK